MTVDDEARDVAWKAAKRSLRQQVYDLERLIVINERDIRPSLRNETLRQLDDLRGALAEQIDSYANGIEDAVDLPNGRTVGVLLESGELREQVAAYGQRCEKLYARATKAEALAAQRLAEYKGLDKDLTVALEKNETLRIERDEACQNEALRAEDAVERAARALIEREADQMEQDTDGIATLDRWDECDEPTREVYRDEVRFVLAVLP